MTEVNDIIIARHGGPDAFARMIGWSLLLHVVVVAAIALGLIDFGLGDVEAPRTVMTISLAGAPGPSQGMTPMGGRNVPAVQPQPAPRPVPVPAAPRPQPTVTPRTAPQPAPPRAENTTRARQPAATPEPPQPGSTRTETGARGAGFGLATGGGGGTGVQLDVANFCCPDYIRQMTMLIQQNWTPNQGILGATVTKFTITRQGTIEQIQIERSSGFQVLDDAATRALLRTRLPELPPQYPNATLGVHVTFQYQR